MRNNFEARLSRVERRLAQKTEKPKICNCREKTRYHNADCLDALLKRMPMVCPVHGFRQLGRFWWTPSWCVLRTRFGDDNQYCPCPPHPWRSFVLNGPHTREAQYAAQEARSRLPPNPPSDLQEENRRIDAIVARYRAWVHSVRAGKIQLTENS